LFAASRRAEDGTQSGADRGEGCRTKKGRRTVVAMASARDQYKAGYSADDCDDTRTGSCRRST
jgi:hypothetical protein